MNVTLTLSTADLAILQRALKREIANAALLVQNNQDHNGGKYVEDGEGARPYLNTARKLLRSLQAAS